MKSDFIDTLGCMPLVWLVLTLAVYVLADQIFQRSGRKSWANPVLLSMLLIGGFLTFAGVDYATYFEGARIVHFMLGPATIALALPIYENRHHIRAGAIPILAGLLVGSVVAVVSALVIGRWLGLPALVQASIAPKSATTAVAFGISEAIGGLPTLTAALVPVTGVIGAMLALPLFAALRLRDERATGLAMGVTAHGIGTARAFQASTKMGAFAGIGMALNAVLTSMLAPLALMLFG